MARIKRAAWIVFFAVLALNIAVWFYARPMKPEWSNVPPVPAHAAAHSGALGDSQLAYRANGIMIQNLGETGGRTTRFPEFDYVRLTGWFFLQDALDPKSHFIPLLAAGYFGATREPEQIALIVSYLVHVGERPGGERWRWLVHAAHLARHRLHDVPLALGIAHKIAARPDSPPWGARMPAMILSDQGEKEAAYQMLMGVLASSAESLHPNEVGNIVDHICNDLLEPREAALHPLCQDRAKARPLLDGRFTGEESE